MKPVQARPMVVDMPPWGVVLFESHHAADFRMAVSCHDWLEVFFVLDGQGVFEVGDQSCSCGPGDVVVVPIGYQHRILDQPRQPTSVYVLRISRELLNSTVDPMPLPPGRLPRDRMLSSQVHAEFRRLLFEQTSRRPYHPAMMTSLAMQLLVLLARSKTQSSPATVTGRSASAPREKVEAYVAVLQHQFFEPVKLDNVAKRLGISRRRFTELFREVTGASWAEYVRRLRVEHSKHLLQATPRSVMSIAFECGFEDLSSFYRAFQSLEGTPPHRWRQRQGPGNP